MTPRSISADLAFAIETAKEAGDLLLRRFRNASESLRVEHKGFRDLVTAADHEAERHIVSALGRRFPRDDVLSEESAHEASADGRLWIVDPLDGTTNYTHGHPLFAVSIGMWEAGEPRLGVVHAPALRETYWAESGAGAYRDGHRVAVTEETDLAQALLATGFSYERRELERGGLEIFGTLLRRAREVRRGGSASLDLAQTAAGVFGGFWEYYLHPHDVAAGVILILEAGGKVSDVVGGEDFLFGRSIVAGSAAIHSQLLEILRAGPPHPGRSERDGGESPAGGPAGHGGA